jgi:hypothetical protein
MGDERGGNLALTYVRLSINYQRVRVVYMMGSSHSFDFWPPLVAVRILALR